MPFFEKLIVAMIVAASIVFSVQSMDIRPPARSFPLVVSVLTGVFSTVALIRTFSRPLTTPAFFAGRGGVVLISVAGFAAYVLALPFGFIPSTLAFLFVSYLFLMPERSARSVLSAAAVSVAATTFTWLCFRYWLGVNLPTSVSLTIPWLGATRL